MGNLGFGCVGCLLYVCTLYVLVLLLVGLKCYLFLVLCILELGVLGFLISWVPVMLYACKLYVVFCVLEYCVLDLGGLDFGCCGLVCACVLYVVLYL